MNVYDKIILIASKSYDTTSIQRYNSIDYTNACIVRFNKVLPSQAKIFNGIYHIRFLRGFHPHVTSDYRIIGHPNTQALHYIYRNTSIIKKVNKLKTVIEMNETDHSIDKLDDTKSNSLGYTAYKLLSTQYPDIPIYLIGFTFLTNNRCHNGEKEQEIMLADPRVTVL